MPIIILVVAVWLLKRSRLAKWSWNPLDWWNNATSIGSTILSDVKNWVLGIVADAVNLVENDVQSVWLWAWGVVQDIQTAAYWFSQWTTQAIDNLGRWANDAINGVEGLARSLVGDLGRWANDAINGVAGLARSLVDQLGAWTASAINGVEGLARQLVGDLGAWAASALATLEGWVKAGFSDVYRWVTDSLSTLWRDLYGTIYRDFIKPIEDVIAWVVKAWDWVVWFAEHPFAVVDQAESDVLGWLQNQATDALESSVDADVHRIESTLGKWLGVG